MTAPNKNFFCKRSKHRLGLLTIAAAMVLGCSPPPHMSVQVRMLKAQENYFRQSIIADFNKTNHTDITVVPYNSTDSIDYYIQNSGGQCGLIKIPFDKRIDVIDQGILLPLESIVPAEEITAFRNTYLLTSLGRSDNKQYLVPRKFETRIMVYCKSKVASAVAQWRSFKTAIDEALKPVNGYGLPATYILESDPNTWDYYDLFVVGYIWAHTSYEGRIPEAKIANRGRKYSGTSLGVIDRIFSCNGDSAAVLNMTGAPVVDALEWEAVYAAGGIYNKHMWQDGWAGAEIWQGFAEETVFLSFMTQLDCFFIHGTGQDSLDGFLKNPDDFGVATMPTGGSVELDRYGAVARTGSKAITTGGWWWGIPKNTPYPKLSYQLVRAITSTAVQIQESSRFGMIPVRKDILGDMSMMFGGSWITTVYETSFKQLMANRQTTIPGNRHFSKIAQLYLDAWYDIVVNRHWSENSEVPDRVFIERRIATLYAPQAALILGTSQR